MGGVGDLRASSVRPLRSSPRAAAERQQSQQSQGQRESVASFSVDYLRNGGTMNVSSGGQGNGEAAQQSAQQTGREERQEELRERYAGHRTAPSARRDRGSHLSEVEQVEQLKKVKKAATDYEATFMDQLVKAMRQSPLTKTAGGDTMTDIGEQPFKNFLAQAGGLGLADQIVAQVARQEGLEQTLQKNPGIMGPNWKHTIAPSQMFHKIGQLAGVEDPAPAHEKQAAPANCEASDSAPADPEKTAARPEDEQQVGLMSDAEIAYLYEDATQIEA